MLSRSEIADMRAVAEMTFDSAAVIATRAWVSDGGGGGTTTFVAAGTVACHLSPVVARGEQEPVVGGRISPAADWVATVPAGTDVPTDARLMIDGTAYEVIAVRAPRTWELTRRVELTEVS